MKNVFNLLRRLARNVTVPLAAVCLGARADFTNEFVVTPTGSSSVPAAQSSATTTPAIPVAAMHFIHVFMAVV